MMLNFRYDFPAERAAFVDGTANFAATLTRDRFPYRAGRAEADHRRGATLRCQRRNDHAGYPTVDLAALSSGLSGSTGSAALSLSADPVVMLRVQAQQVLLVLQYHFGAS
jgi:hypothetical protein